MVMVPSIFATQRKVLKFLIFLTITSLTISNAFDDRYRVMNITNQLRNDTHPMIAGTLFKFEFELEGTWDTSFFDVDISSTTGRAERDTKRKLNKLFKKRGMDDFEVYSAGNSTLYVFVDQVRCVNSVSCTPKNDGSKCERLECGIFLLHSNNRSHEEAQIYVMQAVELFFTLGDPPEYAEEQRFVGPYPKDTTIEIGFNNVPKLPMEEKQKEEFTAYLKDFIVDHFSSHREWVHVTEMEVTKMEVGTGGWDLRLTVVMLSLHSNRPSFSFERKVREYLSDNSFKFISLLQQSQDQYFLNWDDDTTMGMVDEVNARIGQQRVVGGTGQGVVVTSTEEFVFPKSEFRLDLVWGILAIFCIITGMTAFYAIFRKTQKSKNSAHKESSVLSCNIDDDCTHSTVSNEGIMAYI